MLSEHSLDPADVALLLFHHRALRKEFEGKARLPVAPRTDPLRAALVVEAAGHGFEVVAVRGDADASIE